MKLRELSVGKRVWYQDPDHYNSGMATVKKLPKSGDQEITVKTDAGEEVPTFSWELHQKEPELAHR